MKLSNHKAYTDMKDNEYRVILVKSDNSVLKVLNTGIPSAEIAKGIAARWNENIYKTNTDFALNATSPNLLAPPE